MACKRSVNTKQISTVAEYLEWVKNIHDKHANVKVFYRGMADSKWDIIPSLFRYQTEKTEKELLQSATNLIWNELKDTTTYLEKLIILQHYGFPTRLLDVTTNPLVALYFACWKEEKEDGSVYVGFTDNRTNMDNLDSIEHICKLLFEENYEFKFIKPIYFDLYNITDWDPLKVLLLFNTTIKDVQEMLKAFDSFNFRLRKEPIKDIETLQDVFNTRLGFEIGTKQIINLILLPIIDFLNIALRMFNSIFIFSPIDRGIMDCHIWEYESWAIFVELKLSSLFNTIFDELCKLYPKLTSEREGFEKELRSHISSILYNNVENQSPPLLIKLAMCYMLKTIYSEIETDSNSTFLGSFDLTKIENLQQLAQTYFIFPPHNNDRIIAQSGAFIIPSLLNITDFIIYDDDIPIEMKIRTAIYINGSSVKSGEDMRVKRNYIHFESKIGIPSKNKKSILKELETYGIHEGSLFPDTEHKLKYLADSNSIKK